jgi:2,4-dienoyl-CoA reductase-like NADH-dependent reductase (Old Yellow Enzyme family)
LQSTGKSRNHFLNTGIGWHEARIPTIVTSVPRAAFVDYTAEVKQHVSVPVIASNRINMPDVAEEILLQDRRIWCKWHDHSLLIHLGQ